jgi:hypothetical protein
MDELESLVNVAMIDPSIELEIRIGKIAFGHFRTDISSDAWHRVKERLESYPKWSKVETESFVDERFRDVRRRTFSDGRIETIQKERVSIHDIPVPDKSMDLRISLAREHRIATVDSSSRVISKETKKRHRFVHKEIWAFELTEIEGTKDIDSECANRYQIEIEFRPSGAQKYPCRYLADYGKLLAEDVLSMMMDLKHGPRKTDQ